jgi:hypothetical protein
LPALAADGELLARARAAAPVLWREHPQAARAQVARWLENRADYLRA